jgi:3-hydroxyisobutyrate dehydrogenase-like beta-hydroxyacid dehydrogenase
VTQSQDNPITRAALVGYGEVGKIFCAELRSQGLAVSACDRQAAHAAMRDHARAAGVPLFDHASKLPADPQLFISAVTAASALEAARDVVPALGTNAWFLDINSTSPATKQQCAEVIESAGGRFVEAAVMSAVPPYGLVAPMLLGGPRSGEASTILAGLGFRVTPISDRIGVAAATKMCRSVIVKGLEAIVVDGLTAARRYGVEKEVITYLEHAFPGFDWQAEAGYFFERIFQHGRRRGEEMQEAAATLREAGLGPAMPAATAERQLAIAEEVRQSGRDVAGDGDWQASADLLIELLEKRDSRR